MECRSIQEKTASIISQVIGTEIPADPINLDNIKSSCGRLFYEGTDCSSEKMETAYKFKFRWYDENWNVPLDKIHSLENYLREAAPEVFSDNSSSFYAKQYKINSSSFSHTNISGMLFYCAELNFSIIF